MTFPISVVTMRPSSSFFRRKIRAASRRISPRRGAGVFRHLSNAPFAARTASPNSSFVGEGNVARTSPVAGLIVSNRLPSDFFHFPPMKRPYSWTIDFPLQAKQRPTAKSLVSLNPSREEALARAPIFTNDHAGLPAPSTEPRLSGTGRPTANESKCRNCEDDRDSKDDLHGARNRRRPTTRWYPVDADRPKTRFECRRSMQNCNG